MDTILIVDDDSNINAMLSEALVNNEILDLGLSPNELKVAVCLYSCVFRNNYHVQIKQSTIAEKCGIKKTEIDIGTIAAISVAFTGIATVVGGLMQAFLGLGAWIPLGILGIILLISLPSMFIAWNKLRQRNIAPILDASGWAINGNVKISIKLGNTMTQTASRPKGSSLNPYDPFEQKGFPIKRVIFAVVIVALIVLALVLIIKNPNGIVGVWENIKGFFGKFMVKATETVENAVPAAS